MSTNPPSSRPDLPVHFFTVVLNGMPYLRHHVEQMRRLDFDWHWHVVEGATHRDGRSVDGTSE